MWWILRRKKKKPNVVRKFVAGVIIGGAIASIVGKHLLDKHGAEDHTEDDKD